MTSFACNPAIASTGSTQNGWIRLVHASPQATAVATRATSAPSALAAGRIAGPWTAATVEGYPPGLSIAACELPSVRIIRMPRNANAIVISGLTMLRIAYGA